MFYCWVKTEFIRDEFGWISKQHVEGADWFLLVTYSKIREEIN